MTADRSVSPLATWMQERRLALKVIASGSLSWAVAFVVAWFAWPAAPPLLAADRVSYALQLAAAPAILLLAMVCACFRLFDTPSAENPLLGGESQRFRINQRVLSNTIEQFLVFVPLVLALAPRLPAGQVKLLPIAVTAWCLGRLMFWVGYHVAPHWRGPGFDWTISTSFLLAGWFVYTLI